MNNRIEFIDGHRGLAILLVIGFHAYSRWPSIVPYGDCCGEFPPFRYGYLGVHLFFVISGFVILMTLERCASAREFLTKRWLRLFPAMLACALVLYLTAGAFAERPAGLPAPESLLPALTFVDHEWWERILGRKFAPLEGAFWSLYVEFKFYVLAAIVYYWRGRNALVATLTVLFLVSVAASLVAPTAQVARVVSRAADLLSLQYFGWFAAGAGFYVYHGARSRLWLGFSCAMLVLSALAESRLRVPVLIASGVIGSAFALSVAVPATRRLLEVRFLQFFGFVSYPLYLIHENTMVSVVVKLGQVVPEWTLPMIPLLPVALLSGIAWGLARWVEPSLARQLRRVVLPAPSGARGRAR